MFRGKSPDCQTVIEGSDARTEKRVSVRISDVNCVLSTCFAPPTAVPLRRGRRAHLRLGRRSVHHGLSVHRLTRGEAKRVREKQSGSAPNLALCLEMPKSFWDEDPSAHSPGHNVAKRLRVRQLVARSSRSVLSRVNGGGGREGGGGGAHAAPLEAPSNANSARWMAQ